MTDRDEEVHTDTVTEAEAPEPNEYGFAGGAATPSPQQLPDDAHTYAEEAAIPAGDLTGAISDSLTPGDEDER